MFRRVVKRSFKSAMSKVLNVKQIRWLFSTSVGKQLTFANCPLIYDTINQKLGKQAEILEDHPFHIFYQHEVYYFYLKLIISVLWF